MTQSEFWQTLDNHPDASKEKLRDLIDLSQMRYTGNSSVITKFVSWKHFATLGVGQWVDDKIINHFLDKCCNTVHAIDQLAGDNALRDHLLKWALKTQVLMWLAETLATIRSNNEEVHIRGDLADWKFDPHAKVPFQPNTYDCGVHTLWHLKHIINLGAVDVALVVTEKAAFEDMRSKGFVQTDCAFAGHSLGKYSVLASITDVLAILLLSTSFSTVVSQCSVLSNRRIAIVEWQERLRQKEGTGAKRAELCW
ncbi:hypothetical protein BT96DRAFT_946753 [Gymnopus androsaceus JB14]|uniref:Ubiquitin-like protease family profile domain-containing protein n=1 Tax=Gymnopus androsaceus JB14 TaxID=1447944 RepID=A0A6A4GX32_9AGAR|nr:hypothetical protein BT96DRAFT_946753 [Gymnopus androsaceus JB14]